MFGLFGQRKLGAMCWPWRRNPESRVDVVVERFLALTAQIADDAAVAIDADLRRLIADLAPADQALYESIVRVPGAFPPYLVWAMLTALGAEPVGRVLGAGLARRIETSLLETAALTRGKANARLLSALLYRAERAGAAAHNPLETLVPRFWEEVQRMGALSEEGCRALTDNPHAQAVLERRFAAALRRLDERDGGYWETVKPELEGQEM